MQILIFLNQWLTITHHAKCFKVKQTKKEEERDATLNLL